ncbi:tetratricopeptide repeat protein [Streptosporangium sp. NPDC048865]|uniref:tetratricopeptide repeat protein n=1 Tax=Streptosporangium sp. NPDC048865 TaxID=3155766 RepID=UPI003446863F
MSEPAEETYDVFIVHARADLEWARQVLARLSEDKFRAALEDYLPGDIIVRRIEDLIRASKNCVFVYSRAIEGDPMADAKYAALVSQTEARRFIPALLDDVPLGPFAASRQVLDFRGEDQDGPYRELLRLLGVDRPAAPPLTPYKGHGLEGARDALLRIGKDAVVFRPGGTTAGEETADLGTASKAAVGETTVGEAAHRPGPLPLALEERLWQLDRARRGGGALLTKDVLAAGRPGAVLEARLREAGTGLGETFLFGKAGEALAVAVEEAAAENRTLRLGLQVDDDLAGLPWETVVLPGQTRPLALHPCVELFRHLPATGRPTATGILAPLRILAVVASPEGPDSGPLLDVEGELRVILDSVEEARRHAAAHVRILNEGTLDAIERALKEERFHVLHISCHAEPGALLLEDERGGADKVTAARLAGAVPRDRGVPLVVLSGCSTALDARHPVPRTDADDASPADDASGGEGDKAVLTGLARGLSAAGVPAVLAMTAPVTDRYATLLSGALYRELAVRPQPDVLTALSEARRDLEERRGKGDDRDADLVEWATPALFLRGPSLPLYDVNDGVDANLRPPKAVSLDPGVVVRAVGDFVGRRSELRTLRAALRGRPGVLLHGIGGVGKSSLAAELIGTLGAGAGLVVSHVGQGGPDQILTAVADKLLAATSRTGAEGEDLRNVALALREPRYPWQVRLDALAQTLAEVSASLSRRIGPPPVTLLLDDFEDNLDRAPDFSFLDADLPEFLAAWLRVGKLLVTSRHPFPLPDDALDLLYVHHLGPLSFAEARKLMWRLPGLDALTTADRERAWADVGGHPRTLEYLDALLRGGEARFPDITRRLERLLRDRGDVPDPAEWLRSAGSGGLDAALAEAVTLAVDDTVLGELVGLLDDFCRRVLVGASVFRVPVDRVGVAWPVSEPAPEEPDRLERLARLDELLRRARVRDPGAWLEDLGLSEQEVEQARQDLAWRQTPPVIEPAGVEEALEVLAGLGLLARVEGPARSDEERPFLVHRWTAGTLAGLEMGAADGVRQAHVAAARFWHWWTQARPQGPRQELEDMLEARFHWCAAGDLNSAAVVTDWVCKRLHTWGAWSWEEQLHHETLSWFAAGSRQQAVGVHQLGIIAHKRGEYERALEHYHRSLTINEKLGDRAAMARGYHQLGIVAQERGEHERALELHRRALAIDEEVGDQAGMAGGYHHLGMIAQERGEHERALEHYHQALTIKKELGDQAGMAGGYHNLGMIAQERGEYERALEHYHQALTINEELGDRAGMARGYHHLGIVAQERGEHERALEHYRQALTVNEELGNRMGTASNYSQIGALYTETGRAAQAVALTVHSLLIRSELQTHEINISLLWLGRQRDVLGEPEFRRLLAEHLSTEDVDTVVGWLVPGIVIGWSGRFGD